MIWRADQITYVKVTHTFDTCDLHYQLLPPLYQSKNKVFYLTLINVFKINPLRYNDHHRCLYRSSQILQTLTAAVSSRIDYRPLWLSRRREKLRAGSFAGLQKSSWSVKKRKRKTRTSKTMAVFKMDNRHRIRSTRAGFRMDPHTLVTLHRSRIG